MEDSGSEGSTEADDPPPPRCYSTSHAISSPPLSYHTARPFSCPPRPVSTARPDPAPGTPHPARYVRSVSRASMLARSVSRPPSRTSLSSVSRDGGFRDVGTEVLSSLLGTSVQTSTDVSPEKGTSLLDYSARYKVSLTCFCLGSCATFMCYSLLAPFFPKVIDARGISSTISGWIFGSFSLVQCLLSPIFGKLVPILGSKFQFLSGLFILGGCTILFGMIDDMTYDNGSLTFIVFAFVLRVCLAVGASAASTAVFTMATNMFTDNVATVMGLMEASIGVGLMVGPAVGGVIYEPFGFKGPFFFVGGFILLTIPIFWIVLKSEGRRASSSSKEVHQADLLKRLMSIPVVLLVYGATFVAATTWIVLDPTLEPHLRIYNLSSSILGLVFLIMAATYAFLSPVAGRLADRMANSTPLIIIGCGLNTLGLLFLGPSPLIGLDNYRVLWLDLVSLTLIGLGCCLSVIPTYDKLLQATKKAGLKQTLALHALIGGTWGGVYSFGEFIGPVLAGWLVGSVDFDWTMTIMAFVNAFMMFVTLTLWLCESHCPRCVNHSLYTSSQQEATQPLLSGDT